MPNSQNVLLNLLKGVHLSEDQISRLSSICQCREFVGNSTITQQYAAGSHFYLLESGEIDFFITLENEKEELLVGSSDQAQTPIGWSGFRSPGRYATTVRCKTTCSVVEWEHAKLQKLLIEEPVLGIHFLRFIIDRSNELLKQARNSLFEVNKTDWNFKSDLKTITQVKKPTPPEPFDILRLSPFFEHFDEKTLKDLSKFSTMTSYDRGSVIIKKDGVISKFSLLARGKVAFSYSRQQGEEEIILRSFSTPGWITSWAGGVSHLTNDISLITLQSAVLCELDKSKLEDYILSNPKFGLAFTQRILWLLSNHLRAVRAQLISQRFEREILAIKNLIEQNCIQLSVQSPLHKIPHLLSNTLTLGDAFQHLHQLLNSGNTLEKSLSSLCLDILGHVHQEHEFFHGLQDIYQSVVNAPPSLTTEEVRRNSANKFIEVFEKTNHVIAGWENLPEEPGCIFIYNHLRNHEFNTLPNHFQLTLDSHFLSSMILHKKYGDPGRRVVRMPRGEEYGHHFYYSKLGHITVLTNESNTFPNTKDQKQKLRQAFYSEAGELLENGHNILMSPEGTSYSTEESPGRFKAGAFNLASNVKKDPFIVPISVANFDKRLNHTNFAVIIQEPFKISEVLKSGVENKRELFDFLASYQKTFSGYVEETRLLADQYGASQLKAKPFTGINKSELILK